MFTVKNYSTHQLAVFFSCTTSGPVTCSDPSILSASIAAGVTKKVYVTYSTTSGSGSAAVTLEAEQDAPPPGTPSTSWASRYTTVIAGPAGGKGVPMLVARAAENLDRGRCLTVGAGEHAGLSCGDLIITEDMPAYRTMGQDRRIALHYNSATATGLTLVPVKFVEPLSIASPNSVRVLLTVDSTKDSLSFATPYSDCGYVGCVDSFQVAVGRNLPALQTGVHDATVTLRNIYSSSCLCDSTLATQVLAVNRSASEYGTGWSLLGIEQLFQDSDTTRMTWLAGDGSARVYHRGTPVTSAMLTASGLGSFSATGAVDGSTGTVGWTSGTTGAWVRADFGAARTVTTLAMYNSGTGIAPYHVQYSDNGTTWATAFADLRLVNGWREVTWASVGAHRYWRLYQAASTSGSLSVRELNWGNSSRWYGAPGNAPDSLVQVGSSYVRYLKHGAYVTFDAAGKHISTTNRTGQQTVITWSPVAGQQRIASITVPPNTSPGRSYTFQWNSTTGMLQSITDPAGRVLRATVTNGRLMKLVAPGNLDSTRYVYDGRGVLIKRIAARQPGTTRGDSAVTTYTYAHNARVTQVDIQADSAGSQFETTAITPWDDRTILAPVQADSLGPATRVDGPIAGIGDAVDILVGAFGQPTRIAQLGLSTVTRIRYDSSQTLPALATEVQYPHPTTAGGMGRIVRLSWNGRGNLVQQRDSTAHLGSIGGPTDSTTYIYGDADAPDSPSLVRNGAGQTLSVAYNGMGLPETTTDQRGHVTSYSYTTSGTFKGQVDTVTELSVPVWSEAAQAVSNTSLSRHFTYDASGNLLTDSLPTGIRYTYAHDNTGAVSDTYDPIGMRRRLAYDALGRVVQDTVWTTPQASPKLAGCKPAWFVCAMADSARPVNAGIPSVLVTTYVHSPSGLVSVSDPRQVSRSWRHDARGNVVAAIDDYGHADHMTFRVDGLANAAVSRMGDTTRFYYDGMGRRVAFTYPAVNYPANGLVPADSITSEYDLLGRATTLTNRRGRLELKYLATGAIASSVDRAGYDSVGYQYDVLGRRTVRVHQDLNGLQDSVRYTYNTHGDLDSLIVRWGAPSTMTTPRVFRFTWDGLGRRTTILYPTGTPLLVTYAYDASGALRRVKSERQGSWSGPDILAVDLQTTAAAPTGQALTQQFTCHGGLLVGDPCSGGGILTDHYAFNTLGWQVEHASSANSNTILLRYDGSGNLVKREQSSPVAVDSFYIPLGHNNLTRVTRPGDPDFLIQYDSAGRRMREDRFGVGIWRAYYYDGLGRTSGLTTISAYNGQNWQQTDVHSCGYDPLGRQVQACTYNAIPLGLDGESILRAKNWAFVSGPGLDDPLLGLVRGDMNRNIELFYVTDGQGRHLTAAEATGTVDAGLFNAGPTGQYAGWDATGAASAAQSYGANRLTTVDAPGLAFYRNRIYDQNTGRWTQEDPLGVAGGLNLYQFNGNDPVSLSDPFGLSPCRDYREEIQQRSHRLDRYKRDYESTPTDPDRHAKAIKQMQSGLEKAVRRYDKH
jgi:RHS repeat-associated protein